MTKMIAGVLQDAMTLSAPEIRISLTESVMTIAMLRHVLGMATLMTMKNSIATANAQLTAIIQKLMTMCASQDVITKTVIGMVRIATVMKLIHADGQMLEIKYATTLALPQMLALMTKRIAGASQDALLMKKGMELANRNVIMKTALMKGQTATAQENVERTC